MNEELQKQLTIIRIYAQRDTGVVLNHYKQYDISYDALMPVAQKVQQELQIKGSDPVWQGRSERWEARIKRNAIVFAPWESNINPLTALFKATYEAIAFLNKYK